MSYGIKKVAYIYHRLFCDGPNCEAAIDARLKTDLEELEILHGWVRVLDHHFCRECSKSRKENPAK